MNLENKKQVATIVFAAGVGLLAVFFMSQHIKGQVLEQTKQIAQDNHNRNAGVIQELEMVKQEIVRQAKNQAALDQQQKQLRKMQEEQKVQIVQVPSGTTGAEESEPEEIAPFSFRTPPGKRAFTIMIDSLSAVGGLVNAGDAVDIIAQLNIPKGFNPKGDKDQVTTMLFQNLQVLAVGTNFDPISSVEGYNVQQRARSLNLTLAVEPEEAAYLTFAQTNGKLQLALRSPRDQRSELIDVASWDTLSDYVLERQGTEIDVPAKRQVASDLSDDGGTSRTTVQVYRRGREL